MIFIIYSKFSKTWNKSTPSEPTSTNSSWTLKSWETDGKNTSKRVCKWSNNTTSKSRISWTYSKLKMNSNWFRVISVTSTVGKRSLPLKLISCKTVSWIMSAIWRRNTARNFINNSPMANRIWNPNSKR